MAVGNVWFLDALTVPAAPMWVRRGHTSTPPGTIGSPSYVRPTGGNYIRWEDVHVGAEDLYHTAQRLTGVQKLTYPIATVTLGDFKYGGQDAFRSNGFAGSPPSGLPSMIGLLGSGIDQTIVTQTPNVNTHTQATAEATGTNQLYMLNFTDCNNPEVAGFTLKGTDQSNAGATSQYYNGILFYNGTGGNVHDLKIVGAGPGYASAPPGETFLLNTNKQNSMTWSDIELDGRLNGTGTSTSSTNFSFNNATGNNVYRLYSHHTTYGAGTTQYQCNTTNYVDTRTTNCTKPQMNFERAGSSTGGVINIVRHNFDSSGTCQIAITSDTGWTTLNIYDPILTGISQIHLRAYTTYAGGTSIQRSHLGAINCWVGGSWDDVTKTYTGGTLRNDLLNVTT